MIDRVIDVAILALHGVVSVDLAIPCDVFSHVRLPNGKPGYRVRVCGEAPEIRSATFSIRAPWTLEHVADAGLVIIPGVDDPEVPVSERVIDVIRSAARNGARVASICTGAFVLAATGLLDGKRATTHWLATALLKERYPAVVVDADVLYVDNGKIITSAGVSAGFDMCFHLVRCDYGQAVAAHQARLAVAALEREGGQAQFIENEAPVCTSSLAPLLDWMQKNAKRPLTLEQLAARAATSSRTLSRRFKEQTGTTPLQWLLSARVRNAQALLETTRLSVEEVAAAVGFDGSSTFRNRFRRTVGVSPNTYRRTFQRE
jgi:transcriptional regulator GlxA family with amidase domain